jgi:hypothetical protein
MLGQQIIEEVRPASAVFGLIDWLGIPASTRAKSIGMWHGLGNVVVMLLFGRELGAATVEPGGFNNIISAP